MQICTLGRTGLEVGEISLGTEYLIEVPRQTVVAVVRRAIERGINYLDVLFAYPHYRDNLGAALEGLRDQVLIAGHLGAAEQDGQYRLTRDPAECEQLFGDLLRRLKTDYVDVLFLTNCDEVDDYERIFAPGGLADMARRYQQEGKARFIGFSGHRVLASKLAVESGAVDVLMHNVSLASGATPGRIELYQLCAAHDVGLIGMKPFGGGGLLSQGATPQMTPVQCLSYVLSQPGVSTALPGVKNVEELDAALEYHCATDEQRDFSSVVGEFQQSLEDTCVYCNHCHPCPSSVDIGKINRLLDSAAHGVTNALRRQYAALAVKASDCIECGVCSARCPFGVDVVARMKEAASVFEDTQPV